MLQSFFTDTIESKFIKELLYKTPLPLLHTKSSGDYVVEGFYYIYGGNIIKCTKSGVLNLENSATYEIIDDFEFGVEYPKITQRHVSKYNYYDTDTHERLGTYLRTIRDMYGVDLMPLYNCFSYKSLVGFHHNGKEVIKQDGQYYKLLGAPIKFNTTYTISFESPTGATIYPVFYNELGIIESETIGGNSIDYLGWSERNTHKLSSMIFTKPQTIKISNADSEINGKMLENLSNHLYLVVQAPISNTSSILIQEGDYTSLPHINNFYSNGTHFENFSLVYSMENINKAQATELNRTLLSPISLQTMNTHNSYAFSNRLIEYLLLNVITSMEEIGNNIEDIQKVVFPVGKNYWKGIWDNALRCNIYNKFVGAVPTNKNKISQFRDTFGYVDKDVEGALGIIKKQ